MNKKTKINKEIQRIITMFLMKHGFNIVQKDVLRSSGVLDIVSEKSGEMHFFEIQNVSCKTLKESFKKGEYIPAKRLNEIQISAQLFMRELGIPNKPWHLHLIHILYLKNNTVSDIKFTWDFNF